MLPTPNAHGAIKHRSDSRKLENFDLIRSGKSKFVAENLTIRAIYQNPVLAMNQLIAAAAENCDYVIIDLLGQMYPDLRASCAAQLNGFMLYPFFESGMPPLESVKA